MVGHVEVDDDVVGDVESGIMGLEFDGDGVGRD